MPIPQHILAAYQRTAFQADTPVGRLSIRCGELNHLLDALLHQHGAQTWAYITAWNPRSRQLTVEENARRQSQLISRLSSRFTIYEGQGVSADGDWPPEPSVLVIGVSEDEACRVGREYQQNAIVVGTRCGPAELRVCSDSAEVNSPQRGAPSLDDSTRDWLCRCPLCDAPYLCADEPCCRHLVTDWCFTVDYESGVPRGVWASDREARVLVAFEAELDRLVRGLEDNDWPVLRQREFLRRLPRHLDFISAGGGPNGYDGLLRERLATAPGYVGSVHVATDSLASDAWDVHWAHDGAMAARTVEDQFREDLLTLELAIV